MNRTITYGIWKGRLYAFSIDPKEHGFKGTLLPDCRFERNNRMYNWKGGSDRPTPVIGRNPLDKNHLKVFVNTRQRDEANYLPTEFVGNVIEIHSKEDYDRNFPVE